MAQAIEQAWDGPVDGLVVTRYGHTVQCRVRWSNRSGSPRPRRHGSASALRSTIADLLRERIIDGETKLGTKLSDHELSQEFEMYCNTLRDALRLLSRDRRDRLLV